MQRTDQSCLGGDVKVSATVTQEPLDEGGVMALDVGIYAGSSSKHPLDRGLVVSLENGDIALLYEAFEDINNKTGVEIVPWDDARLEGGQLNLLDEHLVKLISVVNQKPSYWEECVGFQIKPKKKKVYVSMTKLEVLEKLKNLRKLIGFAKDSNRVLFFLGD